MRAVKIVAIGTIIIWSLLICAILTGCEVEAYNISDLSEYEFVTPRKNWGGEWQWYSDRHCYSIKDQKTGVWYIVAIASDSSDTGTNGIAIIPRYNKDGSLYTGE